MVVETKELRHNMVKQEVHNLGKHCRRVNSSLGFYSPSWIYMGLDFSPMVVDSTMEGSYSPLLTCMQYSE